MEFRVNNLEEMCDAMCNNNVPQQELIKNMECVSCRKMFDCKGKPRDVDRCVNYEERKDT